MAIARALITKPTIVLADELTGNHDSKTSAEVMGIIKRTSADYVFDWTFQVGDTVKFRWFDGQSYQETEYTITDEIFKDPLGGKLFGKTGFFLLPDQLLQKMVVPDFNFNSHLLVGISDFFLEPEIRGKMNSLVETIPTITMETLHNFYQDSEAMYQRASLIIWELSSFIMLFAGINTLIVTTLSRKHEFSTLRSIGMGESNYNEPYNGKEFYWLFGILVLH